jgi:hypothetical protein
MLATPRRLLGMAQAAQGRYADALENWDRWLRADGRQPDEEAQAAAVTQLRDAAAALGDALRGPNV